MPKPKSNAQTHVQPIPVHSIRPCDNDRTVFDAEQIAERARDIEANGLISPIILRPIQDSGAPHILYEIVAGECRWRAHLLLERQTIDAIVRELSDEQASKLMLAENLQRSNLDAIDEANAYRKRMDKFHWSVNQVAENVKKNPKHVAARLMLLECLPEMQDLMRKRLISTTFGEVMAPLDTNRQRIALAYITSTEKPLLREFKALCGRLLAEQNQGALLDLTLIPTQAVIDQAKVDGLPKRWQEYQASKARFPINSTIPELKRVGNIGQSFEAYLDVLLESDDPQYHAAAAVVGRVYDSMVRYGLCFPPRKNT